ncbi:MAG: type I-E CRISPR-associated protein Cas5/CasD [Lentisphaeria bacterium]|nr:type I-E CRISPR-associated protein Cas5/CasD [Lentisphaeria bacterium]
MKFIALWLEGPLQAWGHDSKFDLRNTLEFPTKSGVYGLLLAASGDSGAQETLLAEMADAPFLATAFAAKNQPPVPLLRDYHMVGGGYNAKDNWQSLMTPRKSDGGRAVGGGLKQTYRYYLQDAAFGVLVKLPKHLAEKFAAALQAPVYDLYLGRKCCVPSEQIFRGLCDSEKEALDLFDKLGKTKGLQAHKIWRETKQADSMTISIYDVPLRFGKHKVYRDRLLKVETLDNNKNGKSNHHQGEPGGPAQNP